MKANFLYAVAAGVVGWAVSSLLLTLIPLLLFPRLVPRINGPGDLAVLCIFQPLMYIALTGFITFGTGLLAVLLCRTAVQSLGDCVKIGVIAGVVLVILDECFSLVLAFIVPSITGGQIPYNSANSIGVGLVCCFVIVVLTIALAGLGGLSYGLYKQLP